ncbi:MAG TPA: ATP-binding protein [Rhizomicrobium sp.]
MVRIGLTFLLGLVLLQAVVAAALLWPDGRPTIFLLVSPRQTAAIARALEASNGNQQSLIVAALNTGPLTVHLLPDFPPDGSHAPGTDAPYLKRLYGDYATELGGRAFQVQARGDSALPRAHGWIGDPGAVRLQVQLRTGSVLDIERAPVLIQRLSERFNVIAGAAAAILVLVMLVCLQQMARPARRLAMAARGLAANIDAADLPVAGATEIRVLSTAFNDMKHTIRGLMDERTRVIAAIAHDLRTYLTRLRLRADFIADPEQQARAIEDLTEMGLLIDDTIMFAREATGRGDIKSAAIDVRHEIQDFVSLRREIGEPVSGGVAGAEPLTAHCAPLALRRMLANLTDNALRYGKTARLEANGGAENIRIIIDDDGPGVPAEAVDRLMKPFERLEPSRGRRTGGAGLGLAIVKALARSQHGDLLIENRQEGGLRATIILKKA